MLQVSIKSSLVIILQVFVDQAVILWKKYKRLLSVSPKIINRYV